MPGPKSASRNRDIRDLFAPRAIEGDPEVYTPEELRELIHYALQHRRGRVRGRDALAAQQKAEEFRRKYEIVRIFRGLPERLRKRPSGQTTKDAILRGLKDAGVPCSERTLMRDYRELGGAEWLRAAVPPLPGEDMSSPFPSGSAKGKR
jgi:hypothetical protein